MARKAFVVNEAVREKVRHLAGVGVWQDDIAKIVGCAPKTLRKRFRDDLDRGVAEANATVFGYLFAAAKAGKVTAQIFWLKARAHWREKNLPEDPRAHGASEPDSAGAPCAARQQPGSRTDAGLAERPGEIFRQQIAAIGSENQEFERRPVRIETPRAPEAVGIGFLISRVGRPWRIRRSECRYPSSQRCRRSPDRRAISCAAPPISAFTAGPRGAGKPSA
jgi:hypothetical protein